MTDFIASSCAPKLKVALFSGNYNNVVDGPVKALNRLVGFLLDHGHEVRVFAPTIAEPAIAPTGTLISVPSLSIPGRSEYRVAGGLNTKVERVANAPEGPEIRGRIKDILADFSPDIIHLSAPDYLGFSALKFANKHNIPAVASFHTRFDTYLQYYNVGFLQPLSLKLMQNFYGRCEHVYVPSNSMGEALEKEKIGNDIRLWTRGVDGALFSPDKRSTAWRAQRGFSPDHIVVLFVGRIVLEKGLEVFAQTIETARAQTPNLRAMVIGDGPERARFEALLPNDSVFLGHQNGEGLATGYANADIFLNPSITETFGNVTLEAMASGIPTVCARAAGSVSLIEHEKTGLLAPPTKEGLAHQLISLAGDRATRKEYGENARQISQGFDWDEILGGLVANYREAIQDYNPQS